MMAIFQNCQKHKHGRTYFTDYKKGLLVCLTSRTMEHRDIRQAKRTFFLACIRIGYMVVGPYLVGTIGILGARPIFGYTLN